MDVLNAYCRVAGPYALPPMQPGGYTTATQSFTDPDGVWAALAALSPTQGWVQFQSHQAPFQNGLPDLLADWGLVLAAEALTAAGDSLALSLDGAGGWHLTRTSHRPDGNGLYDELTQLAHDPKTGRLRYRRYWHLDTAQGYMQDCACFIGFE